MAEARLARWDRSRPGTAARDKLLISLGEVDYLQGLHLGETGDGPGRRPGRVEVLHKACIVLVCAYWEAYCEDVVEEALTAIVNGVKSGKELPKGLLKQIASGVKVEKDELAMWNLADAGWKAIVQANLAGLREKRNFSFNTPKHHFVDSLFDQGLGLPSVSDAWRYNRYSADDVRQRLDDKVQLRGQIAHRGRNERPVTKDDVESFDGLVCRLAELTDQAVNEHVRSTVGKWLFDPTTKQLVLPL